MVLENVVAGHVLFNNKDSLPLAIIEGSKISYNSKDNQFLIVLGDQLEIIPTHSILRISISDSSKVVAVPFDTLLGDNK